MAARIYDPFTEADCAHREKQSKEKWFKENREELWDLNMGPVCERYKAICNDQNQLAKQLMDSQDEYFKFLNCPPWVWQKRPCCDQESNPYPAPFKCCNEQAVWNPPECDECYKDPTKRMRCVPCCQKAILFEGHSAEGKGSKGYLRNRYNSSLPEYRYCRPPTTNSEYAWRITEHLQCRKGPQPRLNSIQKDFYRNNGASKPIDCAPFHFP